ncbi:MAG: molybdenum cofactor carrier [Gammaproteobacteria bacterium]|nr:MAG: molybdenum cofactor carrier [Gammaproteobacteria bacterium]
MDKIISGGQTGIDRAALDVAIKLNIPHGGWCPKGRKAENGIIPDYYQLQETETDDYSERTKLNIRDSDGTLILVLTTSIKVTDGTILTIQEVKEKNKPYLIVDLSIKKDPESVVKWLADKNIKVLNVAGPRESQSPGIYHQGVGFLESIFKP